VKTITVDTGLNIGVAYWLRKQSQPTWTKCIKPKVRIGKHPVTWQKQAAQVGREFRSLLSMMGGVECAIVEYPEFMQGTTGRAAAETGSLVKLSMIAGMAVWLIGDAIGHGNVKLIAPARWKGQLSKGIAKERIENFLPKYPIKGLTSHEIDAIGIGLWHFGYLFQG